MDTFISQCLSGLASGSTYASLAFALVMSYQATHHINLAQGEMAMFSTYIAWLLISAGVPYWIAFGLTIAAAFLGGVIIERAVIRPMSSAPPLSLIVIFIGLFVILNSLAGWIFTYEVKSFPSPFPSELFAANTYVSAHEIGAIGVTLAMLLLLYVFFRHTSLGLAMRAAAENPVSSQLVGIRVEWMRALGWGLAAAIGAVAGMMIAPIVFLDPNMMIGVLLYAFAAALLGGIDNPWGAALGGLMLGVIENIAGAYIVGTQLKLTVALIVIVLVLIARPSGLFGKARMSRV